jgi:flagellar biogenesis protein FliO
MDIAYVLRVVQAFALVGLLLFALVYLGRIFQRGRMVAPRARRLVTTIESTALAQNVAIHIVRVADKYFLVGGGAAGVVLLSELPADEIEPYVEAQRAALEEQRATLMRPFARLRKP